MSGSRHTGIRETACRCIAWGDASSVAAQAGTSPHSRFVASEGTAPLAQPMTTAGAAAPPEMIARIHPATQPPPAPFAVRASFLERQALRSAIDRRHSALSIAISDSSFALVARQSWYAASALAWVMRCSAAVICAFSWSSFT